MTCAPGQRSPHSVLSAHPAIGMFEEGAHTPADPGVVVREGSRPASSSYPGYRCRVGLPVWSVAASGDGSGACAAVDLRISISSRTICLMSARRARRQVRATTKRAARATNAQAMAAWTDTWVARNSAGTPATELTAATIGLAKLNRPPGGLRCATARWSGGSQRRSLKCSSEQALAVAAENPRAMAALRIITEGAGL